MFEIILIIVAGFITGFFSGALGIGTSILLVPLLSLLTIIKNHRTAIGTTLIGQLKPNLRLLVVLYSETSLQTV